MDPDSSSFIWQIVFLAALTGANAFFSMSEISIITLNDAKLRKSASEGNKKASMLVALVSNPATFLSTIQVGNTLSGFLAVSLAAVTFTQPLEQAILLLPTHPSVTAARIISIAVITLLASFFMLVFGELVSKKIAMWHFEKIAMAAAVPLSIFSRLAMPFVRLLSASSNGMLRLMGINPDQRMESVTEEEIRMLIDVGNESGNIEESEKDMINNIFEFDDRTAEEMMSHRTEIVAVELGAPLQEIVDTAVESGRSRIPVYEGDIDSIVGILYVKDLLELVTSGADAPPFDITRFMREPLYVLESTNCKVLMTEFKQKKIQMAVVVDEYGGTAGLVTMEDLLEAIVGNIQDEYDDEEEDISPIDEDTFMVDGLADLEQVAKFFDLELSEQDEEDFETIGGYIVNCLGHIPAEREQAQVALESVVFTVQEMEDRRISKLKARRVQKVAADPKR